MAQPSLLIPPQRFSTGKLFAYSPQQGTPVELSVTRGTTAFRTNVSGTLQSEASGIARLDYRYAGALQSCPALLVEPAATNQIRNNSMQGAVAGTPGTLPTNWTYNIPGLSSQIVAVGTENGVDYVDIRLFGTAAATEAGIRTEAGTQIVATSGQVWTHSVYFKLIAAPQPPTAYQLGMIARAAAGGATAAFEQAITPTSNLVRYTQTATLTGATTERVQTQIRFVVTNGASYDFTIRIGWPQIELGSVATSPIRTTAAAATRNADVISLTGASGYIGQTQGTIYAEVSLLNLTTAARILAVGDGTVNNRIAITIQRPSGSPLIELVVSTGGVLQVLIRSSVIASGTFKIAAAYNLNDFVLYVNGVQIGTDTSGTVPACPNIYLGSTEVVGGLSLNDHIRCAAIYKERLTNAELASLTTL